MVLALIRPCRVAEGSNLDEGPEIVHAENQKIIGLDLMENPVIWRLFGSG